MTVFRDFTEGQWVELSRFWWPRSDALPPVAMINIYCDESDDGTTYALAGWIASPSAWDRFVPVWGQMLRDNPLVDGSPMPSFHASEIVERQNISDSRFKGWTFDQEVKAFSQACDILLDRQHLANAWRIGVSIVFPADVQGVSRRERDEASWLMLFDRLFWLLLRQLPAFNGISFVFDNKPSVSDNVNRYFYAAKTALNEIAPGKLLDDAVAFRADEFALPLQAADLLAYEWRKRTSDRIWSPGKATRRSYQRLKDGRPGFMECYRPPQMLQVLKRLEAGEKDLGAIFDSVTPDED